MPATRTDWLTVNGVNVRLVIVPDGDDELVRLEAQDAADLEGIEPGLYLPTKAIDEQRVA